MEAMEWWDKGVKLSSVPVRFSTGPVHHLGYKVDWYYAQVENVAASLAWLEDRAVSIAISAPRHSIYTTAALWHELGHLHVMTPHVLSVLIKQPFKYRCEFRDNEEIKAWAWAKRHMHGVWKDDVEEFALRCLQSYGIKQGSI